MHKIIVFYKFTSVYGYLQYFRKHYKTFYSREKIQSNLSKNNKIKVFNTVNDNVYKNNFVIVQKNIL